MSEMKMKLPQAVTDQHYEIRFIKWKARNRWSAMRFTPGQTGNTLLFYIDRAEHTGYIVKTLYTSVVISVPDLNKTTKFISGLAT